MCQGVPEKQVALATLKKKKSFRIFLTLCERDNSYDFEFKESVWCYERPTGRGCVCKQVTKVKGAEKGVYRARVVY